MIQSKYTFKDLFPIFLDFKNRFGLSDYKSCNSKTRSKYYESSLLLDK